MVLERFSGTDPCRTGRRISVFDNQGNPRSQQLELFMPRKLIVGKANNYKLDW